MTMRITLYDNGNKIARAKTIISFSQIKEEHKFIPDGFCNCNGIYTEKYRNDKYKLKVRPRRNQFQLLYRTGTGAITNWITIIELKAKLDELIQMDI